MNRSGYSHLPNKAHPDGEQWFGALLSAAALSFVWPLSLPVAYGIRSAREGAQAAFYLPPAERERIYRDRISQLEREVGIR